MGHHIRKTDLLNRSGVTLFLIALLSLIAVYYSEAVDTETERRPSCPTSADTSRSSRSRYSTWWT